MEKPELLKTIAEKSFETSAKFLKGREDLNGVDVLKEWRMLLTKKEIKVCVKHMAYNIQEKFRGKRLVIVCILRGCVYFFTDLTRNLTIPHSCYMLEMSSYHDAQTQSKIEILSLIQANKFKDIDAVLIIDELRDNGTTMETAKQLIIKEGNVAPEKVFTAALFEKNHNTPFSPLDFVGIVTPNVWLVGMGLDNFQHMRNWTYLYACPKADGVDKDHDDKMFDDNEFYGYVRQQLIQTCNDNLK